MKKFMAVRPSSSSSRSSEDQLVAKPDLVDDEQVIVKKDSYGLINEGFAMEIREEEGNLVPSSRDNYGNVEKVTDNDFPKSETKFNRSNTYTVLKKGRRKESFSSPRYNRELVILDNPGHQRGSSLGTCRDPKCPHQGERGLPAPPGFPQPSPFFSSSLCGPSPCSWQPSSPTSLPPQLSDYSSASTLSWKTSRPQSPSPSLSYPVVTLPRSQRRASSLERLKTSASTRRTSISDKVTDLFLCGKDRETPESFQMTLPHSSRSNSSCSSSCSCSTSSSLQLPTPPKNSLGQTKWCRCDLTCFIISAFVSLSLAGIAALLLYLHLFAWPVVHP